MFGAAMWPMCPMWAWLLWPWLMWAGMCGECIGLMRLIGPDAGFICGIPGAIGCALGPIIERLVGPVGGWAPSCGRLGGWKPRPPVGWIDIGEGCGCCALARWMDGNDGTLGLEPLDRLGWLARERTLFLGASGSEPRPRSRIAPLTRSGSASLRWLERNAKYASCM